MLQVLVNWQSYFPKFNNLHEKKRGCFNTSSAHWPIWVWVTMCVEMSLHCPRAFPVQICIKRANENILVDICHFRVMLQRQKKVKSVLAHERAKNPKYLSNVTKTTKKRHNLLLEWWAGELGCLLSSQSVVGDFVYSTHLQGSEA